ncbi:MAG: hypothetical protein ACRDIL_18765, partial [Candidatus Limnocylindrales bacterium]
MTIAPFTAVSHQGTPWRLPGLRLRMPGSGSSATAKATTANGSHNNAMATSCAGPRSHRAR